MKKQKKRPGPQSNAKLSTAKCATLAKNWQLTKVNDLGNLFYAFDDSKNGQFSQTSQRVLAFQLNPSDVALLFNSKNYQPGKSSLSIYMGCTGNNNTTTIPTEPGFAPFIQCYVDKPDGYKNSYSLTWDASPPFSTGGDSGAHIEIPVSKSAAELFVTSWCKQSYESLGSLFESAIADSYVARVQSFIFPPNDVDMIYQTLMVDSSGFSTLYVLLGVELTSEEYPFGFRPVIQTKETTVNAKLDNGASVELPNYYEFSKPCPPFCGSGG